MPLLIVSCLRHPALCLPSLLSVLWWVIYIELRLYHGHFQCHPMLKLHTIDFVRMCIHEHCCGRKICGFERRWWGGSYWANALNSLKGLSVEHREILFLSWESFRDLPFPLVLWSLSLLYRYFDVRLRGLVERCFPRPKLSK